VLPVKRQSVERPQTLTHPQVQPQNPYPTHPPHHPHPPEPTCSTDTDRTSEAACVAAIHAAFPEHAILGEEGGVITGDVQSEYLW